MSETIQYRDYLAPMEGITNHVYRNAYHAIFHPMDKYFTPFISAKPRKKLSAKEIREVSPQTNRGLLVIPQILTNNPEDFMETAKILKEEYGHRELNLNLGCPSPTVTAKGKGSGFLAEPEKLKRFLDSIFSLSDFDISIKTRVGTDYEEDWDSLLTIYRQFPIKELIIHPRIQKDYYKYTPRLGCYKKAEEQLSVPLCYNGDLFSPEAYEKIKDTFSKTTCFMYGRGVIANPGLPGLIREGIYPKKKQLEEFHRRLLADYEELLSGDRNVLFRMKELWHYLCPNFTNYEKYAKKIKKSQHLGEYKAVVNALFSNEKWLCAK